MEQKTEMTSLDIRFLIREMKPLLIGGFVRKIYHYGKKQLLFEIFTPKKGAFWLYVDDKKIFITKKKEPVAKEPTSFCMFLRKYLMGKRIKSIMQYDFDRIVELFFDENIVIFELFHPGNVIICDLSYNILMPLEIQRWKGRTIKSKTPYKYPPRLIDPFKMDFSELQRLLQRSDKKTVAFLATTLGFGATYANEICFRAGITPEKLTVDLGLEEVLGLHKNIVSIEKESMNPCIYDDVATPFSLKMYKDKPATADSFSDALDEFFSEQKLEIEKEEKKQVFEGKKEKIEKIVEKQEQAEEKWSEIREETKTTADLIYANYSLVEGVLNGIQKAKDMGLSWDEIKKKIESEDTPEANAIKEIREGDGVVVILLNGKDVELDMRKSVEENAAQYYEDSKWAKKKLTGTEGAKEEFLKKIKGLEEEPKEEVFEEKEQEDKKPEVKKKKSHWYEKFKWFFSSEGFLVIAGRSADQNERILKKHTEARDLVFHADIPGAAFVVIKSQGLEIPDKTRMEAAEFSAANSKAWVRGFGKVDVFSANPEQVSKTPPSGQYLPKGSFMVTGERTWYRDVELKLSIGIKINHDNEEASVVSGPVLAVRKNSDYLVTIKPGFKKSLELARKIKNHVLIKAKPEDKFLIERIPLDEIQKAIPSGVGDIVQYG